MAINKPTKPSVSLPDSFGGIKTPYTKSQIESGYEDGIPQIVDGGNINYEKDAVFKNTKYLREVADTLVDMPIGKLLTVDSNNRFEYMDKPDLSSYQLKSNLSQSLDTSTTKYPCNNAVKTQIDLKANNSDVLHKTGDETKSGVLAVKQLITNEGNGVVIKGTDYDYTLRSTGPYPNGCALIKNNDIDYVAFNATNTKIAIGSSNIPAEIGYMPSDSSSTTSKELVPAGWVNSRITSVMNSGAYASKGSNWVKFTNGLIIQWGSGGNSVTFPHAFTANPIVVQCSWFGGKHDSNSNVESVSTTGCSFSYAGGNYSWIAIGY